MIAGNIQPKETIKIDFLGDFPAPFNNSNTEKFLLFRPHQTISLDDPLNKINIQNIDRTLYEINCNCISDNFMEKMEHLIDSSGIQGTLIWVDPRLLSTECLASFILNWKKQLLSTHNVVLALIIPKGNVQIKTNEKYKIWNAKINGITYDVKLTNPIWYPSLSRDIASLRKASDLLNPYDTFPLLDTKDALVQTGEHAYSKHALFLEKLGTRTRNFIYLDTMHPDRAFNQLFDTLNALPKIGSSIFQPVITPGGSVISYLICLLSGVLSESCFFTPEKEIPIHSHSDPESIIILRKCT